MMRRYVYVPAVTNQEYDHTTLHKTSREAEHPWPKTRLLFQKKMKLKLAIIVFTTV